MNRMLAAWAVSCLLAAGAAGGESKRYIGPWDLVPSADGSRLFVVCLDGQQVLVVDTAKGAVLRVMQCRAAPTGAALSPDGKTLFVTCGQADGTVEFLDADSGKVLASVPAGHTPTGPSVSPDGKRLYVCNRFNTNVSVIDVAARKEVARVPVVREPVASAITPDGKLLLVTNHLPLDPSDSYDVACVVTLISTADHSTQNLRLLNGSTAARGICVSPDGKHAYVVHLLSRYQLPTTQLERGWMNTNALTVIDVGSRKLVNTVLLDEVDLGAASPWDVACTADGSSICVTHASTHEVSVINAEALMKKLQGAPGVEAAVTGQYGAIVAPPNDLAFLVDIRKRIKVQGRGPWGWLGADRAEANGPRGLAVVGAKAFAAAYFSDKLAVVDLAQDPRRAVSLIPLGPTPVLTPQRLGEMNFHDAWLCFQHWQSCASCHPDARADGLNWDLLNDGLGTPKNTKSMLLSYQTPPAMASGVRETAETATRSGFKHILFTVQPEDVLVSVDEYLKALKPLPSPHLVKGQLSEAARRGKAIFFDDRVGCARCHPEPLYTSLQDYDVKSRGQFDRTDKYDTPTLIECWRTAPYMHDGRYTTMKDVFTVGKHGLRSGEAVRQLTDKEIDDLVEFVLSL